MISLITTFIIVITTTSLATFVATRAWDYRPARVFAFVVGILTLLNVVSTIQPRLTNPHLVYTLGTFMFLNLTLINVSLLILLSELFAPHWWCGRCLICWLIIPYAIIETIMALDILGRMNLIFDGVRVVDSMLRVRLASPGGIVLLLILSASWLVHLWLLMRAFLFFPKVRPAVILLAIAIIVSLTGDRIAEVLHIDSVFATLIKSLPVTIAMAYLVIRTRLLLPTRAALDLAIEAMHEAVMVLDTSNTLVYANPTAKTLGVGEGKPLSDALTAAGLQDATVETLSSPISPQDNQGGTRAILPDGRRFIFLRSPVIARSGRTVGMLLMGRDVTEIDQWAERLEQERKRLATTVGQLEAEQQQRAALAETVRALSLPVIPVLEGVLVLPLIGDFDAERIQDFTSTLLHSIEHEKARVVLIDITGLPLLDSEGAAGLVQGVRAAGLLGARCVLVGVRPEIARALVSLDVSLETLATAATLQQALQREQKQKKHRQSSTISTVL
jgi:rsbT co-antagonist protein RsbR